MARPSEDFLLKKDVKSKYWHYRLKGWKSFKSTGQTTKAAAKRFALQEWKKLQESNIISRYQGRGVRKGFFSLGVPLVRPTTFEG